jgi:cation-transporting ATPase 13A1
VFAPVIVLSLVGQFAVHYYALTQVLGLAHAAQGPENRVSPDARFTPNIVNTAVFLITSAMQVATFTINHRVYTNSLKYIFIFIFIYYVIVMLGGGM